MRRKKKIIVVGYPKSGNTWLTRLTAELMDCPVKGFLYERDNPEISIEGLDRISDYECYKSHHQYSELWRIDRNNAKIIYVVRDPRDIVLSGTNFFYNLELVKIPKIRIKYFGIGIQIINEYFKRWIGSGLMKKRMINAVLNGDERVHHWCRISWKNHLSPYMKENSILVVKYEDLLSDPFKESKKILQFMGVKKKDKEIESAIKNQSFEIVKKKFLTNRQLNQARFLRKGLAQQWEKEFLASEKKVFLERLAPELKALGYNLHDVLK